MTDQVSSFLCSIAPGESVDRTKIRRPPLPPENRVAQRVERPVQLLSPDPLGDIKPEISSFCQIGKVWQAHARNEPRRNARGRMRFMQDYDTAVACLLEPRCPRREPASARMINGMNAGGSYRRPGFLRSQDRFHRNLLRRLMSKRLKKPQKPGDVAQSKNGFSQRECRGLVPLGRGKK